MERSNSGSGLKRQSSDSSKRSIKQRGLRSSRTSRESKDSRVSMIKEEEAGADQITNYRESVSELFFESFYATLIVEKRSVKPIIEECHGSSTIFNPSLDISSNNSFISFFDSGFSESSKCGSLHSKEGELQRFSNLSSQSATESTSTNPSCMSTCLCCYRIVFWNGSVYEGQVSDLLMDGKGTFYWRDGSVYKGEFKDGYPSGQGKLILPDLSTYEGDFCMGFFHGNGNFNIKSSPLLYNGEWKISKRNGKGWMLYESDDWYEGDWLDNKRHGLGYRHYANGDKYKGSWLHDKISGEGCMMWHNNDYYNGEWSEGHQAGYGEYTWSLIAHNSFAFPNYNWYQGNWVNGLRTGAGIMNFGHESGAKYAGTWLDNKKNGPGIMICGNGIMLEKNPLFTDDKPSAFIKDDHVRCSESSLDNKKESGINVFKSISKQVSSKENLDALNKESIINITKSGTNIKMKQYLKLLDKKADNPPPLKIPIHNVIHEVDLEYFVEHFTRPPSVFKDQTDVSAMEIEQIVKRRTGSTSLSASCINYMASNTDIGPYNLGTTASQQCLPSTNELRNLIINYLPQLRKVYKRYASLCVDPESLTFEPVLIRMFLWQLYRDIGVTDIGGVSIIEVDEMLIKNPNSCLETTHSPWEQIFFWQFLQSLVGVACMLYETENHLDYTPSSGFMFFMFKDFLERKLLNHAGNFQGNCLTRLRDLIPIDAMYRLYKEIGEPHTLNEFLKNICLKKGEHIPCYKLIRNENNHEYTVQTGSNIVILNNQPSYLEKSQMKINADNNRQRIFEGMYVFSSLGQKKILKCMYKICPQILLTSGKYQLTYRLSFIEFYEAVLLLAFEKVEQERLSIIEDFKAQSTSEAKGSAREMSRASTHSARRRKFKK